MSATQALRGSSKMSSPLSVLIQKKILGDLLISGHVIDVHAVLAL